MKIAFFDSGVGGLTIFNECVKKIKAEYIYCADNLNTPYGIKEKDEVIQYVIYCMDRIMEYNPDIIVIACNTATSIAINVIREKYNKCIIGTEPAVKVASDNLDDDRKILVCATTLTTKEEKLSNLIEHLNIKDKTEFIPLDELVRFAENNDFNSDKVNNYIKEKFKNINKDEFGFLVLGCTHFPLFKSYFEEYFKNSPVKIIDSSEGVVNNIINKTKYLELNESKENKFTLLLTRKDEFFNERFSKITGINNFVTKIL